MRYLGERHSVGVFSDLRESQPLLHLPVPENKTQGSENSTRYRYMFKTCRNMHTPPASSFRPWSIERGREGLHLFDGRRLLPLIKFTLDLLLQFITDLQTQMF